MELTQQDIHHFREQGYLAVPDFFLRTRGKGNAG